MCLNKKVLIGLGALAVAVLIVRPGWAATLLPVLLVAACPLSMMFMMRGMRSDQSQDAAGKQETQPRGQIDALLSELRNLKAGHAKRNGAAPGQSPAEVRLIKGLKKVNGPKEDDAAFRR